MYTRNLKIALVDIPIESTNTMSAVRPLAAFTHNWLSASSHVNDGGTYELSDEIAGADIVITRLDATRDGDIAALVSAVRAAAGAVAKIVLIVPEGMATGEDLLPVMGGLYDLWREPMSSEELSFKTERLLEDMKRRSDAWETAQFLETTINSIPSMVWYKSADGIHHKVNDSFCRSAGKDKEQIEGRGHAYIWNVESDDPACIESEEQVMETGSTVVSEETVKTGDGMRLFTTYKSPLYNTDGSTMGTVGVGIDVTQEREYEQRILEKNKTLETIFTSLQCGVLTHSLDGTRIISINQAALDILGYESSEEMLADGFDMVAATVVHEDAVRLRSEMANLSTVGEPVNTEYRVQHKNGDIVHVLGSVQLVQNDKGEKFYQRFLLDYTEKKLEENRKERRQKELVQALSEDYMVVCAFNLDTGDGEILRLVPDEEHHMEDYFSDKIGFGSTIGNYIDNAVVSEDKASLRAALSAANLTEELETSNRININYRIQYGDQTVYCQATIVRTGDWDNKHEIVMGLRSVDQQTRDEMKKKAVLEDALAQANRASEAKSAFLSNMSHDIRTPMNAIVGFTTLATSRIEQPAVVLEYLDKIKTSSTHLLSLINDILDMSRIESGKMALEEEPVNLGSLVEELHSIVHSEIENQQLSFISEVSLKDPDVFCDKLRMNQVLLNILGNAIKFTEPGGEIKIGVKQLPWTTHGYGRYRFTISDTGIGMSPEFLEHIFDPFERERTSTISGVEGTGLGMTITKNLVDMLHGTISVESEKGKGTTFTVELALKLDSENKTDREVGDGVETEASKSQSSPSEAAAGESSVSDTIRGSRILLVDDNTLNREIAITMLEDEGFEIEYAVDGQEAVDKLVEAGPGHFKLVLMDVQMPVLNGYDATRKIRALEDKDLAEIPIIAMTADAFEEDRQKALKAGMNGHLPKPIEMDKLFATLEDVLEGE